MCNFLRISSLMISDLKAQESMHGSQGPCVLRRDADARAARGVFQPVLNLLSQLFHGFRSRRILRVDEHRRRKIAFRKHLDDMDEMRANGVSRGRVFGLIDQHIDGAAVWIQREMVGGFVVGKTHHMVSALDHALLVRVLRRRFVLFMHGTRRHIVRRLYFLGGKLFLLYPDRQTEN